MFTKLTIRDVKIRGKVVLVRTDYNVPIEGGKITNDLRIRASLPTIQYLLDKGAKKVILMSHLGRPDGQKVKELSLLPVAETLAGLLPDKRVRFVDDVSGPDVEDAVDALPTGGILLLENLRFYPGEEKNSDDFIREIVESTHAELFVQDGFAVVHRAHASTSAVTKELPSVAGLLVEKEVSALTKASEDPTHPVLLVIAGAKVEDKQPLIDNFLPIADHIAVAGKIAADGYKSDNPKIYVAEDFAEDEDGAKLDIGPVSTEKIVEMIRPAKTIIWNGLTGQAEDPRFDDSSIAIAKAIAENKGTTVICGGNTSGFVEELQAKGEDLNYTLVSTGGGASLEFLSGLPLPGIDALDSAE